MAVNTNADSTRGHLMALFTIIIWGTTFISTKILFKEFQPAEILFFRFVIALIVLFILDPHRLKGTTVSRELILAAAGLCGVTLYFLLESTALTYTYASNVSVIVSISPLFTAILSRIFYKQKTITPWFIAGFIIAITGICLISFKGQAVHLSIKGDLLSLFAAFTWAAYSTLCTKINSFGYPALRTVRREFTYGLIFMIPALFVLPFNIGSLRHLSPVYIFNFLYLGVLASAICFFTWNTAVKKIGAIQTSIYIYLVPVVTVIASILILHEKLTIGSFIGMILTLSGLALSQRRKGNL